jgi:hypothetical protein
MDEIERTPQETSEGRDSAEDSERNALDDATLDPSALVEQSGVIRQAENIQETFTSIVEEAGDLTGLQPKAVEGPLEQESSSGDDDGDEATPINLPGPQQVSLIEQGVISEIAVQAEEESVLGSRLRQREDLDQATIADPETVKGDEATPITLPGAGGQEATPITLPGARSTASEQAATEGRAAEQAPVEVEKEPSTSPEMERRGADTGTGPEGGEARGMPAIPLEGEEIAPTAETVEAGSGSTEQPDQALEGGQPGPGGEADLGTSEAPVAGEVEENQEALGEGEEDWTPPPMYAHVDSSGVVTIVDENGKPIDSPPNVQNVVGEDGKEKYMASYEAGGKTYSFEVTSYISSLSDLYVGYDQDGKLTVVNGKGETVGSPPVFTKFVDDQGVEKYVAYYPGAGQGSGVVLEAYSGSLQGCYAYIGQDGKVTIVDGDGNPLTSQPLTYKVVDDKGVEQITAYYPGAGESGKVTLSSYTGSLEGCYTHIGQDGKVTIVDADGNPLKCQPVTYKFVDDKGVEQVTAFYPGAGESGKITLSSYTASLQGCYASIGQDGKVTIVDADGKALNIQPSTYKFVDNKGVEHIAAYYPGAGQSGMTTLSSYTTSLQSCSAHVGQDGKVTVVGADGKPLNSQPLTYKYVDGKGVEHIIAYYPGDSTKTTLNDYLPPSGTTKSGGSV